MPEEDNVINLGEIVNEWRRIELNPVNLNVAQNIPYYEYQAVKRKEMPVTPELKKLEEEVRRGIFNNNTLRLSLKTAGASATYEKIRAVGRGGGSVTNCTDCHQACFISTLNSCYGGLRWTCPDCSGSYTFCAACASLIIKNDNQLHFHVADLARLRNENKVERHDANIMAGNKKPRSVENDRKPKWSQFRFFGIELELERRNDILVPPDLILKAKYALAEGFAAIKHDGSLRAAPGNPQNGTNGFEVVSLPGTMEYHQTKAGWQRFFEVMKPWMEESPNTTGLHIHISAASMTRATIGKMVRFINHPDNLKFMKVMANRDFTRANPNGREYACVYPNVEDKVNELITRRRHAQGCRNSPQEKVLRNYYHDDKKMVMYDGYGHPIIRRITPLSSRILTCDCPEGEYDYGGHYAAFNVRTGKPTVEIRMFQGSTNEAHFWAALEFADALVMFCEANSFSDMRWQQFISWFKEHRYLYKSLARWLVVGGFIEPLKKKES